MGSEGADNTYGWGFIDTVAALDRVLKVKEIEASDYSVLEDTNVVFTATSSGTNIEQYDWDFDNDGYFDLTTEENTASYIFSDQDDYTIRVQITNSQSKTAENTVDISVANRKPDAQLAIDTDFEYIYEDNTILFNSSQSWDTPSDINDLEFSWNFGNGMNFTNFTKEAKIMEHTFQDTGEYAVTVRVKDDDGETDETTTTISVYNMKPIADAGGDREVFEDELVHFSGFNSYDTESDRKSLSYFWEFGDGSKGLEMNMTHSYRTDTNNQVYSVSLTVQDNDNANSEDKIKVTVKNRAPIISDIEDQFGTEDDPIELTGQANDSSSDIEKLKYRWIFDDDEETGWLEEPTVAHTYTQMGTYHPRLIVVDPKDAESVSIANVTIDNIAPKSVYTMDKTEAEEDEFITFDPSDSTDTKSDIDDLKYSWDFGDGSSSTMVGGGKVIKHKFYKTARYTIVLTVTDDNGEQDIMEKQLTITNLKPEAKITSEKDEYQVDELVRVFGYQSIDTPSDKINLTYSWNFDDGSGWQVAGINTTHKYTEPGEYEIRLKVEDDDSEVDIKRLNIEILQPKKEKENIFENPTFENNGMIIYSGLGLLIVILILIVISLIMYQRNRKGLFGALERKMKDRRTKKEQQKADQAAQQIDAQTYDFTKSQPPQEPFGTHGVLYPETQNDAEGNGWGPQGQIQGQPQPQMFDYMPQSQPGGQPYPQPPNDWRQGQGQPPMPIPMQMQSPPNNQTPPLGSEMPPSNYGSSSGSEQLPNVGEKPQMLPPAKKQNDKSEKQTE